MIIKKVKDDILEIASKEEIAKINENFEKLKQSDFTYPLSMKEFFELSLFFRLMKEKLLDELYEERLNLAFKKTTEEESKPRREQIKRRVARELCNIKDIDEAFQKRVDLSNKDFDVEKNMNSLMKILKHEDRGHKVSKEKEELMKKIQCLCEDPELGA